MQSPVPAGLFGATVSLDPEQALGGQVRAGDRVAIVAIDESTLATTAATQNTTTAKLVARNVLVTTVQIDGEHGESPTRSRKSRRADGQVLRDLRPDAGRPREGRLGRERRRARSGSRPTRATQ